MARLRFCFWNAFLLRVPVPGSGGRRHLYAVPAVADRADAIGEVLVGEYDVMALAEVWQAADAERILAAWAGRVPPEAVVGPRTRRPGGGSGLLTICDGPEVVRRAGHVFRTRGSYARDSDAWADKGVQMVEIDVGTDAGHLEIYSSHLCAGGDLVLPGRDVESTLVGVRRAQVEELLAFLADEHRPGNGVVVAGDFNLDAASEGGRWLTDRMAAEGLVDLWAGRAEPGPTSDLRTLGTAICRPTDEVGICAEPGPSTPAGQRLDYVFTRSGDLTVAVRAGRRRAWPRPEDAPERSALAWLSDHIALHVELELGAGVDDRRGHA